LNNNKNLVLNTLGFKHPCETADFYFSSHKENDSIPIPKSILSNINAKILPQLPPESQYIYANFYPINGNIKHKINLNQNPLLAKYYYEWLIFHYFKKVPCITKIKKSKIQELWFLDRQTSTGQFFTFKRFHIKVLINRIEASQEILISYKGCIEVLKVGLNKINAPSGTIEKVIFNQNIIPYDKLSDNAKLSLSKVRPVLTKSLKLALNLKNEPNDNKISPEHYYDEISGFTQNYLNTNEFKQIIPLSGDTFYRIQEEFILNSDNDSDHLIFGNNKTGSNPTLGIQNNGPYKPSPCNNIEFILIYNESDHSAAAKLLNYFNGIESNRFKGLKDFLKMNYYIDIKKSIIFQNNEDPIPEIHQQVISFPRNSRTKYLGIYLLPGSVTEVKENDNTLQNKIEIELLKYRFIPQIIETESIFNSQFSENLPKIAIEILAKLDGIPWTLQQPYINELIIDLNLIKSINKAESYIIRTCCYLNEIKTSNFNFYSSQSTIMLQGYIRDAVKTFIEKNKSLEHLVIHLNKKKNNLKKEPIIDALFNLNLNIPEMIIIIEKAENHVLVLYDNTYPSERIAPEPGTFVDLGQNQFLLINKNRNTLLKNNKGNPIPVKLTFLSTDVKILKNKKLIHDQINQVYQISRMNWTNDNFTGESRKSVQRVGNI
jgi:hypothetical protein